MHALNHGQARHGSEWFAGETRRAVTRRDDSQDVHVRKGSNPVLFDFVGVHEVHKPRRLNGQRSDAVLGVGQVADDKGHFVVIRQVDARAEIPNPRQLRVVRKPRFKPPVHHAKLLKQEPGGIDVLECALVPCTGANEPRSAPEFGVKTHQVLGTVLQHLAGGVQARVVVARPANGVSGSIGDDRVEVIGCQADGIGVRVPSEDIQGGLSPGGPSHQGRLPPGHAAAACIEASESVACKGIGHWIAPLSEGEFNEVVVFLIEAGHVQEPLEPAHLQALLESGFDVDGGFRTQVVVGVHLEGPQTRANEFLGNGREAKPLADTGPQPRGLARLKVQSRAEHRLGGGAVVDAKMLVAGAQGEVESLACFLVDLEVCRAVGRGVDAFGVASVVKLRGATCQLLNGSGGQHQSIHAPDVAALLHLVFGVEDVARVALVVVVVVVEVLPAVAEAVLGATR